ncbi:MAG: DUF459 domain-containing protein [Parvibaculum sp.]
MIRGWGHGFALASGMMIALVLGVAGVSVAAAPLPLIPPQFAAPAPAQVDASLKTTMPSQTSPHAAASEEPAGVARPTLAAKTSYNVVVLGDSLGDGIWAGLYHVLRKDKRFHVIRKSKVATGLVRHDYYNWNDIVTEVAADTKIDIAVVIMGTNDRQPIVKDGVRYALFDPEWRKIYNTRIDAFTDVLKATGARIYWVGLPVMRSAYFERDMETFSAIFKARAAANGVVYIPTRELMTDEGGNYVAYGLDKSGRKRLLRAEDGIHFTMAGYEHLVDPIAQLIRRDVDGGVVTVDASAGAVSAAVADGGDASHMHAAESIGLKAQVYDVAESRPGRSDDWRWTGAAH